MTSRLRFHRVARQFNWQLRAQQLEQELLTERHEHGVDVAAARAELAAAKDQLRRPPTAPLAQRILELDDELAAVQATHAAVRAKLERQLADAMQSSDDHRRARLLLERDVADLRVQLARPPEKVIVVVRERDPDVLVLERTVAGLRQQLLDARRELARFMRMHGLGDQVGPSAP